MSHPKTVDDFGSGDQWKQVILQYILFIKVDFYVLINKLNIYYNIDWLNLLRAVGLPAYLPQSKLGPMCCCRDAVKPFKMSIMGDVMTKKEGS